VSRTLIPAQRRERIQDYLSVHRIAPSSKLSDLLEVSEATIRRDLEWMENEGILVRTHGGAILNQQLQLEPEYQQRAQKNVEEKRAIGSLAASLIQDGEIVFINSGTTTTHLIRQIKSGANCKVITNNLTAALEIIDEDFDLMLTGGSLQPKSNSVAGRFAIENINQIYADQAFIGVDGVTIKHGYTVPSSAEAEVIRLMIARTNGPVNVITDFSKWGVVSNFEIAKIDQVNRLITDEKLGPIAKEALTSRAVEVLIAYRYLEKA
jgi:DeoR/GlpR family transcriptional regulator of sugar metabolism